MRLLESLLHRPVAVGMAMLVIVATGIASALRLPLELTPKAGLPKLSVNTAWPNGSPAPWSPCCAPAVTLMNNLQEAYEPKLPLETHPILLTFQRKQRLYYFRDIVLNGREIDYSMHSTSSANGSDYDVAPRS